MTATASPRPSNATDPQREALTRLLFELTRSWRAQLTRRLRPHGLPEAAWRLLFHLDLLGGEAVQARLAERLGVETPSLVRLLDRMERDGWVRRRAHAGDRRAKLVRATPRGLAVTQTVTGEAAALRAWALQDLDAAALDTALGLLQAWQQRLSQAPEPLPQASKEI